MRTILTCLIFFLSFSSVLPQSGWYWQNPVPQGNPLHDVFFINDTNGWAVGDLGSILYTRDQGTGPRFLFVMLQLKCFPIKNRVGEIFNPVPQVKQLTLFVQVKGQGQVPVAEHKIIEVFLL